MTVTNVKHSITQISTTQRCRQIKSKRPLPPIIDVAMALSQSERKGNPSVLLIGDGKAGREKRCDNRLEAQNLLGGSAHVIFFAASARWLSTSPTHLAAGAAAIKVPSSRKQRPRKKYPLSLVNITSRHLRRTQRGEVHRVGSPTSSLWP